VKSKLVAGTRNKRTHRFAPMVIALEIVETWQPGPLCSSKQKLDAAGGGSAKC
jgi:hypothetical protein